MGQKRYTAEQAIQLFQAKGLKRPEIKALGIASAATIDRWFAKADGKAWAKVGEPSSDACAALFEMEVSLYRQIKEQLDALPLGVKQVMLSSIDFDPQHPDMPIIQLYDRIFESLYHAPDIE